MPLLVAVSLLSAAAIAYEILLTRLFAIALWHHFAYMIITVWRCSAMARAERFWCSSGIARWRDLA
jgi:hypothetical protein